jgi:HSP20 family molecular chaperone IbpA
MGSDQIRQKRVADATRTTERLMQPQIVPVNVYETEGALVVVAPLAAVQPSDVTIELSPGHLRIRSALRSAPPREYIVHEWSYGGYERELDLPEGFGAGVEASLANGQLAVRVLRGPAVERTVTVNPNPAAG